MRVTPRTDHPLQMSPFGGLGASATFRTWKPVKKAQLCTSPLFWAMFPPSFGLNRLSPHVRAVYSDGQTPPSTYTQVRDSQGQLMPATQCSRESSFYGMNRRLVLDYTLCFHYNCQLIAFCQSPRKEEGEGG